MLDTEERSGVTVLRLRHGKVNALDLELLRAITSAMRGMEPGRAVVITGAGSAFSAGVGLRRITESGEAYVREFLPALTEMFMAVFDHPGLVLAAVNGHAIAGGCVLAATLLDPSQARSVGLVHDVEMPDALVDSVLARAQAMMRTPAEVFSFSKRQLQQPARDRIAERKGDEEAVLAMWKSHRTLGAIAGYLDTLETASEGPLGSRRVRELTAVRAELSGDTETDGGVCPGSRDC
jgi:enoyl-CoA hydratase